MASLRKRLSKWALGDNSERFKRPVSMDANRGSIDSGYHSVTQTRWSQASSLLTDEESPKSSRGTLHKALSTTFSYLADTVRQGAASLHQDFPKKDDSSSEQSKSSSPKETPKKQSRRSSLLSSVRSRKGLFSPRSRESTVESSGFPELPSTPTRVSDAMAPVLDVNIPRSSLSDEDPRRVCSTKPSPTAKVLWPSPARVAVGLDEPYIDRDDLSTRVRHFVASELATSSSPKPNVPSGDDKGYVAESESGAEQSDSEVFSPPGLQHMSSNHSEVTIGATGNHGQVTPHVHLDDRSGSPVMVIIPTRGSSNVGVKQVVRPWLTSVLSGAKESGSRLPSEVYEADAEFSETSPDRTPSMGSRAAWEEARADRDRRYMAAVENNPRSEDDAPTQLQLPESQAKSSVYCHTNSSSEIEAVGAQIPRTYSPEGALAYAVEAAERRPGTSLSDDSLPSHFQEQSHTSLLSMCLTVDEIMASIEAHDPNSKAEQKYLSDSDTDVSGDPLSLQPALSQSEDAYEAGLMAAGLSALPNSTQSLATIRGAFGQSPFNPAMSTRPSTPTNHIRSVSNLSEATNDSCAVTTSSPSCSAPPPFPSLHVRSEPARLVSAELKALSIVDKVDLPLTGPANSGLRSSLPEATDTTSAQEAIPRDIPAVNEPKGESPKMAEDNTAPKNMETQVTTLVTPQKTFNAARLPNFGTPSPLGTSPKSRRSLRREKKARARAPFTETPGNTSKQRTNPKKSRSPQFSVSHFKSVSGESSPYSGHELDPVSFGAPASQGNPGSSPLTSDKKIVCFSKDVEIIGNSGRAGRGSPGPADLNDEVSPAVIIKELEKGLAETDELALSRLVERIESIGPEYFHNDKENADVDDNAKADKPRWRVPSKITGS